MINRTLPVCRPLTEVMSVQHYRSYEAFLLGSRSSLVVFKVLFLTFSVLVVNPKKTTLHGGQSRSWSAEQGYENKRKSLAAYPPPPQPPTLLVRRKINKITRRIYRCYAGLGRSRVRTRIPSARRLGQWVWLRKIRNSTLPFAITGFPVSLLLSSPGDV